MSRHSRRRAVSTQFISLVRSFTSREQREFVGQMLDVGDHDITLSLTAGPARPAHVPLVLQA
jgi:hypothetical protein